MLMSAKSSIKGHLTTKFTSEKEIREKGRSQVSYLRRYLQRVSSSKNYKVLLRLFVDYIIWFQIVQDIESLLSRFPQIDLSRLKIATTKKKIAVSKYIVILDLIVNHRWKN